jgi:hypothetical protein
MARVYAVPLFNPSALEGLMETVLFNKETYQACFAAPKIVLSFDSRTAIGSTGQANRNSTMALLGTVVLVLQTETSMGLINPPSATSHLQASGVTVVFAGVPVVVKLVVLAEARGVVVEAKVLAVVLARAAAVVVAVSAARQRAACISEFDVALVSRLSSIIRQRPGCRTELRVICMQQPSKPVSSHLV